MSSSNNGAPPRLPPKPRPFSEKVASSGGSNGVPPKPLARRQSSSNLRPSTPDPLQLRPSCGPVPDSPVRKALQEDVGKRIVDLTPAEANFLHDLLVYGTDEEVEIAHSNLLDETKFGGVTTSTPALDEEQAKLWASSNKGTARKKTDYYSQSSSMRSSNSTTILNPIPGEAVSSSLSSNGNGNGNGEAQAHPCPAIQRAGSMTDSVGSERRQEVLQQRKEQNVIFDRIWQAHENGIAVSKLASRKSLQNKARGARNNAIFRASGGGRVARATGRPVYGGYMNDNRSDNMRRRSLMDSSLNSTGSRNSNSNNGSITGTPLPASLRGIPAKKAPLRRMTSDAGSLGPVHPALRRLLSDSSRKSVTFEAPQREQNQRLTSSLTASDVQRRSLRSGDSFGSIPSIHHGHPVASFNSSPHGHRGSFSSIPSIHHAHPLRSNSVASTNTIASFPALPHVRNIRSSSVGTDTAGLLSSSSVASFSNIAGYTDYEGRDPSEAEASAREEKKVDDNWPVGTVKVDIDDLETSDKILRLPIVPAYPSERLESESSAYFHHADVPAGEFLSEAQELKSRLKGTVALYKEEPSTQGFKRPVLMRDVSGDGCEGVEVADLAEQAHISPLGAKLGHFEYDDFLIQMSNSYDETMSYSRMSNIFRRPIRRSLSDESAAGLFVGQPLTFLRDSIKTVNDLEALGDGDSWQMDDDDEQDLDCYDPWMVIEDEYENGYGGGGTLPFQIIGTFAGDKDAEPHVLSPPLMESLQQFLPFSLTGENFWLKYSLVRDGASMHTFLKHARNAKSSILAIETTDGEVFGAFTTECWRKNWNYFGSGESFLWRMRQSRGIKTRSIIDQAQIESEIDVFPHTGQNSSFQLCTDHLMAVGGGTGEVNDSNNVPQPGADNNEEQQHKEISVKNHEWGHGLTVQNDMLEGTSSPCLTFGSPALSKEHPDGSLFEILNLELWTLTPCYTLEEAEKLELGKLFLENYSRH